MLTLFVIALGIVLVATLGPSILLIYVAGLPLGLFLLWSGAEDLRADEQDAAVT